MENIRYATVEEIKEFEQVRTPDYALLANLVLRAKGPERAMAQFAIDTEIGASTLSRIRYKDGTEVECSCKGFGGTKPLEADDPDRELWRCQLQLHPVVLIEEQDLSIQYCIDIENLESITIAGITYDAADAQLVTN